MFQYVRESFITIFDDYQQFYVHEKSYTIWVVANHHGKLARVILKHNSIIVLVYSLQRRKKLSVIFHDFHCDMFCILLKFFNILI
ncbi:hypothetical protein NY2A_b646R [Paramecium bursaria Chlorella virus NY2A]|uniref:Uncharacterized protein b646R n=1 Tax=Paramecium bursaria Chlorella virus NY2A TaxID=46021 RepID=A7IXH1_PBCVN|nr:hypothetical protein NY2A_b646R [Paramecium bursaria Chlorella virus NY2A]ABT15045.1 hypothetical protein NY2A_b646R [Paramecium bursaria Chlorella virus NY2A]